MAGALISAGITAAKIEEATQANNIVTAASEQSQAKIAANNAALNAASAVTSAVTTATNDIKEAAKDR
ncbi:hypothetical protein [Burkholderia territorii]|uniref:hypothetical protein n=1 Tax=Burkholderia territorii TaxID=1503055 RepID=UPI000AD704DF|nr:hypothetical protein [Burkholderia territorii]